MPALAGILLVVSYNMSELHLFRRILSSTRSDALVMLSTFALTIAVDLIIAIQVGVVLASLLFMRRMAEVANVRSLSDIMEDADESVELLRNGQPALELPPRVEVFEIAGPFFFGAAQKFESALQDIHQKPEVVILRMRDVFALDATGLRVLEDMQSRSERGGPQLVLSGIQDQPLGLLRKSGFLDRVGHDRVCRQYEQALEVASALVEQRQPISD
jgi:SulP family sulfate permease